MSELKNSTKKCYSEYYCKRCFTNDQGKIDHEKSLFVESMILAVRHAIISKTRFLLLISPDEYFVSADIINLTKGPPSFFDSEEQPFYLCSYLPLYCNVCKDELGFVLKATNKSYAYFREKVLLLTEKIEIIDEEAQQYNLNNQKIQQLDAGSKNLHNDDTDAAEQLKQNMSQLNNQLSEYQDLIERQGYVEQGLANVTKIIAKLSKKITGL